MIDEDQGRTGPAIEACLEDLMARYGAPLVIKWDNGSGFVAESAGARRGGGLSGRLHGKSALARPVHGWRASRAARGWWRSRSRDIVTARNVRGATSVNRHLVAAFACRRVLLGPALAAAGLATLLPAQVTWEDRSPSIGPRLAHALTYDVQRGRTVLFGGYDTSTPFLLRADTWEWDGGNWMRRSPGNGPPARFGHALAYDLLRGRTVLFGGGISSTQQLADTWEWDGVTWTAPATTLSPPARAAHALAYDALRGRVVLFGGGTVATPFGDTWEWDGVNWIQRTPVQSPQARGGHGLAFDLQRGRTVLFGGSSGVPLADTWEWDGANWLQRTPVQSPPARSWGVLAYDIVRARTVLFGGFTATAGLADIWEWDGTNWAQLAPALGPFARYEHAMAYDFARSRTVMFGGYNALVGNFADTWEWDGSTWVDRTPIVAPQERNGPALAYDSIRARTVMFGGSNSTAILADTWEWDGTGWSLQVSAVAPPARRNHALAYDSRRGRTVMFGGSDAAVVFSDTWEWDGSAWTAHTPAASPPARYSHALAYDSARGRVVLFGGGGAAFGPYLADTWDWDGVNWLQRAPAQSPPGMAGHALAYDVARDRTVLFGGASSVLAPETWEWDGTNWSRRNPATAPGATSAYVLAYDAARGRTVLFGGNSVFGLISDTWEWDGTSWIRRLPAQRPPPRAGHALAFDSQRGRTVLFGGSAYTDPWEYGPIDRGTYTPFGTGCPGSAGAPALALRAGLMPYPSNAVTVDIALVPLNAAVIVSFGLSRTQWGPLALPLDLTNVGMPGCTLYASVEASLLLFAAGNGAALTFPIPNHQALVGLAFYNQAFVLDPAANAAGFTASNAAEGQIGSK